MPTAQTQAEAIQAAYDQAQRVLLGIEREDVDGLLTAFRVAQGEILGKLHQQIMAEGFNLANMKRTGRFQSLLDSITQVINNLRQAQISGIEAAALNQFSGAYQYSIYALDQATPSTFEVPYSPPPVDAVRTMVNTDYKGAMFSDRIGLITDSMASDMRTALTQSMIQGESMDQAAARVLDIIGVDADGNLTSYADRAVTIARTEIMRAQNMANEFAYDQNSDVVEDTEWVVSPDDKLCRWCLRREGMTDEQIEAADTGKDPFGNSSECPLHPRCRCTKAPKLKSWADLIGLDMPENMADDVRGMRNADGKWEIADMQTFDKWKEDKQIGYALGDMATTV